jgi:F-type H+-transporting ATPase subunit b
MRRLAVVVIAFGLAFTARPALAQEHETGPKKEEGFAEKHELALKWANFLLLAGLLGYFIGKNAGPFFAARSAGIRKDMDESLRQREQAEAKAADVDRRLANLEKDIAALRGQSEAEAQAETERMAQHTADEIAKIQAHAEREIASAGKAARMALKRHAAELAMGLAEQKVRARMTPGTEDALVQGFVRNLK